MIVNGSYYTPNYLDNNISFNPFFDRLTNTTSGYVFEDLIKYHYKNGIILGVLFYGSLDETLRKLQQDFKVYNYLIKSWSTEVLVDIWNNDDTSMCQQLPLIGQTNKHTKQVITGLTGTFNPDSSIFTGVIDYATEDLT